MLLVACLAAATVPERVRIPSFAIDANGAEVMLDALLFRPPNTDGRRIPAVIALHGCGGMYSILKSRRRQLSARHETMAELLVAEGYAVVFPDSFRSRGFESICSIENGRRTLTQAHRRLDALATLAWLQARDDIAPDRIALLGWSHGGSAVLATINARDPTVQRYRAAETSPFFRTAIAFYPGCYESLRAPGGYAAAVPLLMLVGGADDWTSPRPCVALAERLRHANPPASVVVYPDTYHGFDGPDAQGRMHLDVPNGVRPGRGVTMAVNAAAREDAYARVRAVLRDALGR